MVTCVNQYINSSSFKLSCLTIGLWPLALLVSLGSAAGTKDSYKKMKDILYIEKMNFQNIHGQRRMGASRRIGRGGHDEKRY